MAPSTPTVSVIIPTYNYGQYITKAVDSVLNQTYSDYEIIIVDDGSTDDTALRLKEHLDRPGSIISYHYQDNRGPAAARNRGIELSAGQYIAFCDSDDTWLPTKLAEQIGFLEGHPEHMMVFSDFSQIKDDGEHEESYFKKREIHPERFKDHFQELIMTGMYMYPSTVVLRKKVFDEIGKFNERYRVGEDREMFMRITRTFPVGFVDKCLVTRFYHVGSTSLHTFRLHSNQIILLNDILREFPLPENLRRVVKKMLKLSNYELGYFFYANSEYKKAIPCLLKSVGMNNFFKVVFYVLSAVFPASVIDGIRLMKRKSKRVPV